ncbi:MULTISPECIES: DUF6440 family protein [Bacillus]|uniref:DUF6440 family protein n=1 Tax=Bacillus sp. S17B2 TaxID=2918907 RepID=UPI00227E7883|nr:DUF6440 family protein [Bacillus sp. S17B2]
MKKFLAPGLIVAVLGAFGLGSAAHAVKTKEDGFKELNHWETNNVDVSVIVDEKTNIEYIVTGSSSKNGGNITPRLDKDGKPILYKQNGSNN